MNHQNGRSVVQVMWNSCDTKIRVPFVYWWGETALSRSVPTTTVCVSCCSYSIYLSRMLTTKSCLIVCYLHTGLRLFSKVVLCVYVYYFCKKSWCEDTKQMSDESWYTGYVSVSLKQKSCLILPSSAVQKMSVFVILYLHLYFSYWCDRQTHSAPCCPIPAWNF